MKLALFADIHSNLEAITACLAHAKALGARRYAFLGDLVGYGADPVAVLDLIERHAEDGAVVVLGNHDAAALGRPDDFTPQSDPIVRVEATRLRRTIHRYYENGGKLDPVQIDLPLGSYVPAFRRSAVQPAAVA